MATWLLAVGFAIAVAIIMWPAFQGGDPTEPAIVTPASDSAAATPATPIPPTPDPNADSEPAERPVAQSELAPAVVTTPPDYLDWGKMVVVAIAGRVHSAVPPNLEERALWFVSWAGLEQRAGEGADSNPLDTERDEPGATDFNSVHVRNYPDLETGVRGVVDTLLHADGTPRFAGYGPIVTATLDPDATFDDFARGIIGSPWCSGCYTHGLTLATDEYAHTPIPTGQ